MKLSKADLTRFWEKVERSDGCWSFRAPPDKNGYKRFWLNGRNVRVGKIMWAITFGAVPDKLWILHRCDNPGCCNPTHLFLGDAIANNADRDQKGRSWKGTQFKRSALTEADVLEIRRLYDPAYNTYKELAECFGTTPANIRFIVTGRIWKHLPGAKTAFPKVRRLGERSRNNVITDEQAREVHKLIAEQVKCTEIARRLKIGLSIIYNISAGRAWAHVK